MTELSRFQKDVEVAASALEMRAENEDAKEEAFHLYRKFGSTKQEPLRLAVALRGYFLEEGVEEAERADYGAYLKKRIRPAVERLILKMTGKRSRSFMRMSGLGNRNWKCS